MRVVTRPVWRLRAARECVRYLLSAAAVAGLLASARFALAPPRPLGAPPPSVPAARLDPAAAAYAVLFARRFLTWNAAEPGASERALMPFTGGGVGPGAGFAAPPAGVQHVLWAEVVQTREPVAGAHVYTVAAETDTAGLLYLAVPVERTAEGIRLSGFPALIGPPASAPAAVTPRLREVGAGELETVVARALRNYLAGSPGSSPQISPAGRGCRCPVLQ